MSLFPEESICSSAGPRVKDSASRESRAACVTTEACSASPLSDFLRLCVPAGSSGRMCRASLAPGGGEDFRAFLRAIDEVGYSCAWRVLDAQYVRVDGYPRAVPQRRRRVFVIGHSSGDWRYPASILFEPDSLFGDTPPRRVKGKGFTGNLADGVGAASTIRMRAGKPGGGERSISQQ